MRRNGSQAVIEDGEREERRDEKRRKIQRRKIEVILPEEPQVVQVVMPPEEKEEVKKMNYSQAPFAPRFELCHVCGRNSKSIAAAENGDKKKYLVCKACDDRYKKYIEQTAKQVVEKKNPVIYPDKIAWARAQLDLQLQPLEQELEATRAQRDGKVILEWARQNADTSLPPEILNSVIMELQEKRRQELYLTVRRQNARAEEMRKRKLGFEQMLAEEAPKPDPVAPV